MKGRSLINPKSSDILKEMKIFFGVCYDIYLVEVSRFRQFFFLVFLDDETQSTKQRRTDIVVEHNCCLLVCLERRVPFIKFAVSYNPFLGEV